MAVPASASGAKAPRPDLTLAKLAQPPAALSVGAQVTVAVEVRNRGRRAAGKSRVTLYLANGAKHTSRDVVLGHGRVKALPAGGKATAKLSVALPLKAAGGGYRLIACADSAKKVREAKEANNCAASGQLQLKSPAQPPRPAGIPIDGDALAISPAFSMTDGIDWGFVRDQSLHEPAAGDPITLTLRAGNRIAGQAGYTQANVAAAPLLVGTATALDFSASSQDDGALTVDLPFAFPFGGIFEQQVSVSTNGWLSFGAPAWDFWNNEQLSDYRGVAALVGEQMRGVMPYWSDLDLAQRGVGPGEVRKVVSSDGSAVAFQWDTGQHSNGGGPRRLFQVVLFQDGSFRFDYPGTNEAGGEKSFVGFSPGTGPGSATIVTEAGIAVPASSLLFTPRPLPADSVSGSLPAGEVTATLPVRSDVLEAGPGCEVTLPSTASAEGLVTCSMPALAVGQQASQTVTISTPPNAPGETEPENFRLGGAYSTAGTTLRDRGEINTLSGSLAPAAIDLVASFNSPGLPRPGVPAEFGVDLEVPTIQASLDEPVITFELPDDVTFELIQIAGKQLPCGPVTEQAVTCRLPSGISFTTVGLSVVPGITTVGSALTLGVTASALNAPPATASVTTPPVEAP
ncbi:MAG TPA: CARDB domain-containing protein [Solirubrobacterales bacterium]|nr:CARDB domain-containing protein [Solirubrobacterales bacterium]